MPVTINRIWLTQKNRIWKQKIIEKAKHKSQILKFRSMRWVKITWRSLYFISMWTLKREKKRELLFTTMTRLLIWRRSLAKSIVTINLFRTNRRNNISTGNIASATNGHCAGQDWRRVWRWVLFCLLINIW